MDRAATTLNLYIIEPDTDLDKEMTNTQPEAPVLIGDGVTVTWTVPLAKALGIPKAIDIAVQVLEEVPIAVAANIITGWLMSRFQGRSEKIIVERKTVEFEEGKVKRIVEETITHGRG